LKLLEKRSHDTRLASLAALANASHFDEVIQAIDSMLQVLRSEEQSDLTNKEACESDRASDTREAITKSREMDDLSDTITTLKAKVAELQAEIQDKNAQVDAINKELKDAQTQRDEEHAAYTVAKENDVAAIALVTNAKSVLETFYKENNLMLLQNRNLRGKRAESPFKSEAGQAPPPPPQTWEQPGYGGKIEESTGIIAILEMIHDDITQDISKADQEEGEALALYTKTKTNLETDRTGLTTAIDELTIASSAASADSNGAAADRGTKNGELSAIMARIRNAAPGCDFVTVNFHVRSNNRKIEIDGLEKAKAILSGAVFHSLPDPNREIKPGDALLLQGRRKFLRRQS